MASWKIPIFGLILASLALNSSTSGRRLKRFSDKHLNQNFMNIQDKFESIDKKIDQLESKGSETVDVHEIIANITHLIVQLNNENAKKFEEKFRNNEGKFGKNNKNFENIKGNLNKIKSILLELKNASDEVNRGRSDDVWRGVTSLCEDKVATWANATSLQLKANLDRIDFLIENEQKLLNACHSNPCLHGGRCRLNLTGSGYECQCPTFTSGSHCKNDECSAEKRCFRFKDTLYRVTETSLLWTEAKVKCEGLNMTLAIPKDEERTLFLFNRLKPIYKDTYYLLWIGLKRDEGMSKGQWEWVDGSALGEYTGRQTYMKSATGSSFGLLYVGGDGSWMWYYGDAAAVQYYSICETRFSTN